MSVKCFTLDEIDQAKWNNLLEKSANATVFHTLEWCQVISKTFQNYHSYFFVGIDSSGNYIAALPVVELKKYGVRNYYSMPYGTYGGIVYVDDYDERAISCVVDAFINFTKGIRTGFVFLVDYHGNLKNVTSCDFIRKPASTHVLSLNDDIDKIWTTKVHQKTRNMVRQAEERGVRVRDVRDESEMRECYKMYAETSTRHGLSQHKYPFELYRNLHEIMVEKCLAKWLIAEKGNLLLGNAVFLLFKDSIFYWDDGSFQQHWNLRPNNALVWSMIKYGVEKGFSELNLGSSPPDARGLVRFKERWGGVRINFFCYEKSSFAYKLYNFVKDFS